MFKPLAIALKPRQVLQVIHSPIHVLFQEEEGCPGCDLGGDWEGPEGQPVGGNCRVDFQDWRGGFRGGCRRVLEGNQAGGSHLTSGALLSGGITPNCRSTPMKPLEVSIVNTRLPKRPRIYTSPAIRVRTDAAY